jgi:hypothetical protein
MQSQWGSTPGRKERRRASDHAPTTKEGATLIEVAARKGDARRRLGDGFAHQQHDWAGARQP